MSLYSILAENMTPPIVLQLYLLHLFIILIILSALVNMLINRSLKNLFCNVDLTSFNSLKSDNFVEWIINLLLLTIFYLVFLVHISIIYKTVTI